MEALKKNIKRAFISMAFCLVAGASYAQTFSTSSGHAEVHGTASVAPDYTGVSDQLQGTIDVNNNTVDFQLRLETLTTGNSRRDKHMYEALETSRFPFAGFKGELRGFNENIKRRQQVTAAGNFTIHGQSKYFEIPGTLEQTPEGLRFSASFSIYITNFGIERPSFLFAEVDDIHRIEVSGVATEEEEL